VAAPTKLLKEELRETSYCGAMLAFPISTPAGSPKKPAVIGARSGSNREFLQEAMGETSCSGGYAWGASQHCARSPKKPVVVWAHCGCDRLFLQEALGDTSCDLAMLKGFIRIPAEGGNERKQLQLGHPWDDNQDVSRRSCRIKMKV
jgi:hypothetical protein